MLSTCHGSDLPVYFHNEDSRNAVRFNFVNHRRSSVRTYRQVDSTYSYLKETLRNVGLTDLTVLNLDPESAELFEIIEKKIESLTGGHNSHSSAWLGEFLERVLLPSLAAMCIRGYSNCAYIDLSEAPELAAKKHEDGTVSASTCPGAFLQCLLRLPHLGRGAVCHVTSYG